MNNFVLAKLSLGIQHVRQHPQLLLIFLLVVVIPGLALITNEAYLNSTRDIQERIYKDRVGLMHDTFRSLLLVSDFDPAIAQREIVRLASDNPDILEFRVGWFEDRNVIPIAALNVSVVGKTESNPQFYTTALANPDESFIYPSGNSWYTYRAVYTADDGIYFIYVKLSLETLDTVFGNKRWEALPYFLLMFFVMAGIGFWLVRITDYRYLYQQTASANKEKDIFTNMMAHELRAPLTAIRGYASMVEEKTAGDTQTQVIRIRESSERLLAIVNDLLDVARIQSGKIAVSQIAVDISPVIEKVFAELNVMSDEKGIKLLAEGTKDPHLIYGDEKRLHQALTNLVSNAVKYTKKGSITVSIEEGPENIELRVKDTGMGITSDNQKKLFAPFFRVKNEAVDEITGTGLGMWITKQLIELMNGTIAVESISGVGTHIVIRLRRVISK